MIYFSQYCMPESASNLPVILITGGTSGLGLELVRLFLKRGYYVIATGRQHLDLPGYDDMFKLYRVDFSDLNLTADTIKTICDNHSINLVINNAGILSPSDYTVTKDGNEYTFQVNFLAHLLINELIIQEFGKYHPLRIAAIISVVYKLSKSEMSFCREEADYIPLKAYSDSKFFLAMMCSHLSAKYQNIDFSCFSIDPGVFGSSIYRMQDPWFRFLYRIAAPFMRKPSKVAKVLADILTGPDFSSGVIFDIRKRIRYMKDINPVTIKTFWEECYKMLKPYLD